MIFVLQVWIVGLLLSLPLILEVSVDWWLNFVCLFKSYLGLIIGPSIDDQAVSLSDDGTTIIIDFFSFLFSLFSFFLSFYRHSTRHTLHLHFNPD